MAEPRWGKPWPAPFPRAPSCLSGIGDGLKDSTPHPAPHLVTVPTSCWFSGQTARLGLPRTGPAAGCCVLLCEAARGRRGQQWLLLCGVLPGMKGGLARGAQALVPATRSCPSPAGPGPASPQPLSPSRAWHRVGRGWGQGGPWAGWRDPGWAGEVTGPCPVPPGSEALLPCCPSLAHPLFLLTLS